jgi:hypothetical protein
MLCVSLFVYFKRSSFDSVTLVFCEQKAQVLCHYVLYLVSYIQKRWLHGRDLIEWHSNALPPA